ncbi:MAG: hypothetical protein RLZZ196_1419 [Bacteroidota bacterium]
MTLIKENDLENKVETLFIPYEGRAAILLETYDKVIDYVFQNEPTYKIKITDDVYMMLSYADFGIYSRVNHDATVLYRTYTNIYQNSTIYGHALVVGADSQSVSQQMIDSILNIFYK